MIRVGLDPAINSPGVGVARGPTRASLELVAAWNVKIPGSFKRLPQGDRIQCVADRIATEILERFGPLTDEDELVYETPQVYGVGKSEVNPNNLIVVAEVATATIARLNKRRGIIRVVPREWTAGTSKNTNHPYDSSRWRRLAMILTPAEAALVPEQHDAIDGVGLALHETPRGLSQPRRVYPGASPPRGDLPPSPAAPPRRPRGSRRAGA